MIIVLVMKSRPKRGAVLTVSIFPSLGNQIGVFVLTAKDAAVAAECRIFLTRSWLSLVATATHAIISAAVIDGFIARSLFVRPGLVPRKDSRGTLPPSGDYFRRGARVNNAVAL